MNTVKPVNAYEVALEPWHIDTLEVLEGDPQTRAHTIFESGPGGSGFAPGGFVVGVYEQEPCRTRYLLESSETVHLLHGAVLIELNNGDAFELKPGDVAVLPKGNVSEWTFREHSRVLYVLSPAPAGDDESGDVAL